MKNLSLKSLEESFISWRSNNPGRKCVPEYLRSMALLALDNHTRLQVRTVAKISKSALYKWEKEARDNEAREDLLSDDLNFVSLPNPEIDMKEPEVIVSQDSNTAEDIMPKLTVFLNDRIKIILDNYSTDVSVNILSKLAKELS